MTTYIQINRNQILEESVREGKYYRVLRMYYKNQDLCQETTYIGRKKNGYMKKWYPSGVLKKHIEYADDKMNGAFRRWYHNGQPLMSGECSQGKRVGIWTYWNNDGSVQLERNYS